MVEKAISIALEAHAGQVDKYGQPYIFHVMRVMNEGETQDEKIAGVLHDIIEDSDWTLEALSKEGFSELIIETIGLLTKAEGEDYLNYVKRLSDHPLAKKIKLRDLKDNMDIRRMDEIREKDIERLNRYLLAWRMLTEA